MPKKDYYDVLGVPPRSHARVIEESYWERAHALHGVPTKKAQQRLGVLNEAYEVLGSPHKRAEYDRRRARKEQDEAQRRGRGFFNVVVNLVGKLFRPD